MASIIGLYVGLFLFAQPAEVTASAPPAASQPADTIVNKTLSPAESTTYRQELNQTAELYSLDSFREGAKEEMDLAKREATKAKREADARARTEAMLRSRKTLTNWRRHPHRRGRNLAGHYRRMQAINEQHRTEVDTADAIAAKQINAKREAARNITQMENTIVALAQLSVHAKYGQERTCLAVFAKAIGEMPEAFRILNASEDPGFCIEAAGDLEDAFAQAIESFSAGEPRVGVTALAGQHAGMKLALERPAGRNLTAYVADAWRWLQEEADLAPDQQRAADYWITLAQKHESSASQPAVANPRPNPAPRDRNGRGNRGRNRNR